MKFVAMSSGGVEVEQVDSGSSIAAADITLNAVTSKLFTIVAQGDLFVREDTKPRSRQLLAGTVGDSVLRVEMRSQHEDVEIKSINIAATGATAAPTGIVNLDLFKDNETTAFATATTCNPATKFEEPALAALAYCVTLPSGKLVVQKTTPTIITVRPRVNNDQTGGAAYQSLYFWMGTGSIAATGLQSSNELIETDNDTTAEGEIVYGRTTIGASTRIVGNLNDIVLAKFSAITNKLPARGIPSGLEQEIARFEFTAPTNTNANGLGASATLTGVIFTVASSNMNFDSDLFKWYRTDQPENKVTCTTLNPTNSGALKVRCSDDTAALNTEVKSGQSVSFSLQANIDSNDVTPSATSTLQVSIGNYTTQSASVFGENTSNIKWTDGSNKTYLWVENAEPTIFSTQMTK
jgi:hypothetical protein